MSKAKKSPKPKKNQSPLDIVKSKSIESLTKLKLGRFCVKKLFEIVFISEVSSESCKLLKKVVEEGKKFKRISLAHFITYDDVIEMVYKFNNDNQCIELPPYIKESLKELAGVTLNYLDQNQIIPIEILAKIVKIKIIEVMYQSYKLEVMEMKKRQMLEEELKRLTAVEEPKGKSKDKKKEKKDKKGEKKKEKKGEKKKDKSEKSKSQDKQTKGSTKTGNQESNKPSVIEDYTDITLEENDIIFDYNIDNQIMFYILIGFRDLALFKELHKIDVTTSSIIKFFSETSISEVEDDFILQLHDLFSSPTKSKHLENTILMKFNASCQIELKELLERLLYVVKRINYIRRQHLVYIKNLFLCDFGARPRKVASNCLHKYNEILNRYPPECVNIPMILFSLIEEVCSMIDVSILSMSSTSESSKFDDEESCICPSGIETFFPSEDITSPKPQPKPYQVHEQDFLLIMLNSYKAVGRKIYDTTLRYLKLSNPVTVARNYEHKFGLKRGRDQAAPSEDFYTNDIKEISDYFHLGLFAGMKRRNFEPEQPKNYEFSENLVTYNALEDFLSVQPRIIGPVNAEKMETGDNMLMDYHWKEELSQSVLLQLIFKSLDEFSCCDQIYCEETDYCLLKFHDNLNHFGIDTKMWNQSLRTPVCLRDFCKYITVRNGEWLEQHKLTEHSDLMEEDFSEEECEGLKNIRMSGMYEEYAHLLGNNFEAKIDDFTQKFNQIMSELIDYPKSESLINYCATSDDDGMFRAYDLGPAQLQLTGATTTFRSYDGVKVIVDSSKFLHQDSQCSINIRANDSTLIFHSKDPSTFHLILPDDTIVLFYKLKEDDEPHIEKTNDSPQAEEGEEQKEENKDAEENEENGDQDREHEEEKLPSNLQDHINAASQESEKEIEDLEHYMVSAVSATRFPNFFPSKVKLSAQNYDRLLELFRVAMATQLPIFKISLRNTKHLKRKASSTRLPLHGIINRVLFKPSRKLRQKIKGYHLSTSSKQKPEKLFYGLRITLPNGLSVVTLPPTADLVEVKQSHQFKTNGERYRLFYKTGVVVIKNVDGSVKILRANGDLIMLTDEIDKDLSKDRVENMSKILGKIEKINNPYYFSRVTDPIFKTVPGSINLYEFGDIPYAKKSILDFYGKRVTEVDGRIMTEQIYYVINESDYYAEERFFQRDDGMKCLIDKKGKRQVQFPDGTKISAWYQIEKELIFVEDSSENEGWISVTINYMVEHPNYVTVHYDGTEKFTKICLNGDITIKSSEGLFNISLSNNLVIDLSLNDLVLKKTCDKCDCGCSCKINLEANKDECLLEVLDSYNKKLIWDYRGHCEINSDYIKGALNIKNCNHQLISDHYQKFFLLNRYLSGSLLWTNKLVETRLLRAQNCKTCKVLSYFNKIIKKNSLEIFENVYKNFLERYDATKVIQDKLCLSKYNKDEKTLFYVTFRILDQIQDPKKYKLIEEKLTNFLETNTGVCPTLIDAIEEVMCHISGNTTNVSYESLQSLILSKESSVIPDREVKSVHEIISVWKQGCTKYWARIRNREFLPYFSSAYYLKIGHVKEGFN